MPAQTQLLGLQQPNENLYQVGLYRSSCNSNGSRRQQQQQQHPPAAATGAAVAGATAARSHFAACKPRVAAAAATAAGRQDRLAPFRFLVKMVLAELGEQISGALRNLQSATIVDEAVVADCVKAVCRALLLADVQLRVVQEFKQKVTQQINTQLRQSSSSNSNSSSSSSSSSASSSSSSSKKKKGSSAAAAAGGSKAFDPTSGTAAPTGPKDDVMAEVYIQAAAAGAAATAAAAAAAPAVLDAAADADADAIVAVHAATAAAAVASRLLC
ncbi:hypothetical protein ACSSS7_008339 [Eimeria intestinalis]